MMVCPVLMAITSLGMPAHFSDTVSELSSYAY